MDAPGSMIDTTAPDIRIDKLLWLLRFAKSRSLAQNLLEPGHVRLNGHRVTRCAQLVAAGDVLVLPLGHKVRVIEVITIPLRRGPASEALACYRVLDETAPYPIAAAKTKFATKEDLRP
jgi:ribosome-associated heat shock protein Hsp15